MGISNQNFKEELKKITHATFKGCLERLDEKEIAGFGLYSDTSAMTISVSCNTFKHLKELQEDEEGEGVYFRWTVGEWKYEMINSKEFTELTAWMQEESRKTENNQGKFIQYRNYIYKTAVEVLEELKQEGVFSNMHKDFVLMFGVSDFSDVQMEISFVKRLNTVEQAKEFEEWLLTQPGDE